jgi:uncharacterized protein
MNTMEMMDHIAAHSFQVCRVATHLVDLLDEEGMRLNRNLVEASSLLHDITKTRSLLTHENHALTGSQLLTDLGYSDVSDIVRQHVRLDTYASSEFPMEAEIVHYADKRVLHDTVVTLPERQDYILQRYGKDPQHRRNICDVFKKVKELEDRLFTLLKLSPEDLGNSIENGDFSAEFTDYRQFCL